MSKEVKLSIEEENEIQPSHDENEIQPSHEENEILSSHEDTTPHKDHGFKDSDCHTKTKDLLKELEKQEANPRSQNDRREIRTKIQMVPEIAKRDQTLITQYFTPREISIGPVHAVNNQLFKIDLKIRLAKKFVAESKQTTELKNETLLGKVKADIAGLKKCYDETVIKPFDDDPLARILFLDGCFVLQFVHGFVGNNLNEFEISNGQSRSIQNDLFLLENQVPFRLLKLLINSSVKKYELVESFYKFVAMHAMSPLKSRHNENMWFLRKSKLKKQEPILLDEDKKPVHLLDLLRSELLFDSFVENDDKTTDRHDLQMFHRHSFRNVQDLKAAGITFKPSDSSSFQAVSFSARWLFTGRLKLPPMIVDKSTATKLWNLVAYEMCPDNYKCDFGVSKYLSFLDSLVDNEQDVRDLRAEHVLRNRLSSDEEVARLFNTIGSNLLSDDAYLGVKIKIQQHYERKWASWVAQVCRDHFNSPWSVLALFAAVIVLVLTGFSTWFTVYPKN